MLKIVGNTESYGQILTEEAVQFLELLCHKFQGDIEQLLLDRQSRQSDYDDGKFPDFLSQTEKIRSGNWKVAKIPEALRDRRVEITGPVDRKMIINALNSEAKIFMADFEDSSSPSWRVMMEGQKNLIDAVNGDIAFTNDQGKQYFLKENPATLIVRPRGIHLKEKNIKFLDQSMPACLVDFGLFFFHNFESLAKSKCGPFFYIPKLEHYTEAALWSKIFTYSEEKFGLDIGTIKATVLIETLPAAFQMDEILWELKEHIVGLNCGRWDYIFSFIKCFQKHKSFVLPDKLQVGMDTHFLSSYSKLLVQTCHKRGAYAMGGMAAQIPIKGNEEANQQAIQKVKNDKLREAKNGHDGTWVAHPGLISIAMDIFTTHMEGVNQMDQTFDDLVITQKDLLMVPEGKITEEGFRLNVETAVQYTQEWLCESGCVPLNNLMEDAATAEISRAQIWQWIKHKVTTDDTGKEINFDFFESELTLISKAIMKQVGEEQYSAQKYDEAIQLLRSLTAEDTMPSFLTTKAYQLI